MASLTPDQTLLGLLAVQPQHGYQLLSHFRKDGDLASVWSLSTSQLYAVLRRLETTDAVRTQSVPSAVAPERTVFFLTESGHKRLLEWLHDPAPAASVRSVRVEFLSRLHILRLLNLPTTSLIARQRTACLERRRELVEQREAVVPGVPFLALELQIAQLDAILNWIDRCELVPRS
jgi:DNA-binding PadR family transcriptional regulator